MTTTSGAPIERLSLSIPDAVETTGLSRATIYRLMEEGELAYVKIRGRRLIMLSAIRDLLARSAV
jgi:excisionase family DNA binding protein